MKAELMIKDDMLLVNGWPIKSWINPLVTCFSPFWDPSFTDSLLLFTDIMYTRNYCSILIYIMYTFADALYIALYTKLCYIPASIIWWLWSNRMGVWLNFMFSCASFFFGFDESDTSGLWWWYITVLASLHLRHSHLGMPSLMIRLGEALDRVTVECFGKQVTKFNRKNVL